MIDLFLNSWHWIKQDWNSHPLRFSIELLAWMLSISCSFLMALTVPDPPLIILYPLWISGCMLYAWAAWSRRSFGMLANYILLVTVDSIGLLRILV